MRLKNIPWLCAAALLATLGCAAGEDGDDTAVGTGQTTGTGQPSPNKSVEILVDANRDGYVNDADSAVDVALWDSKQGAAFLPNFDDDDGDNKRDSEDEVVNGSSDAYDLSRIYLRAFPDAPAGATGTLSVSLNAMKHVRLFRADADAKLWSRVVGGAPCDTGNCPNSVTLNEGDVKNGVQFGIEGRNMVGLPGAESWDGFVELTYVVSVDGKPVSTQTSPGGTSRAKMRVAPWMLHGNSTPKMDTVFSGDGFFGSQQFVPNLGAGMAPGGLKLRKIPSGEWADRWTEDHFQTGVASIPWADGQVVGMRLAMPRPWGRGPSPGDGTKPQYLPVSWLAKGHLYQDAGYIVTYQKPGGTTFDSHGNHDLVPPYNHNGQSFPFGRIIHGSGVRADTTAFYNAQKVQAPVLQVKTSWLAVGHVDEVFSYVPAATPRGWKLLVGSPKLAKAMLQQWQQKGFGATKMHVGKWWDGSTPADISIDAVLGKQDLMADSQKSQTQIDGMVAQMKMEVGLADDEMIELPTLFEAIGGGMVAYQPGVVNLRGVFNGGHAVLADPFGPLIDGKDGFKEEINKRLGPQNKLGQDGKGLKITYTDDWTAYHVNLGEVHCGTNFEGGPQPEWKWWEAMP